MELDWISPLQASEKWGITERQVQSLCKTGKIDGVVKWNRSWLIPKDTPRPLDGRTKQAKEQAKDGKN
jgi:hypothetical protein